MGFYNHKVTFRYTVGHFGFAENVLLAMPYRNPKKKCSQLLSGTHKSLAQYTSWCETRRAFLRFFQLVFPAAAVGMFTLVFMYSKAFKGSVGPAGPRNMKYVEHVY